MKEKFNVSISLKGSDRLDKSVDAFCDTTSRDRACALRYQQDVPTELITRALGRSKEASSANVRVTPRRGATLTCSCIRGARRVDLAGLSVRKGLC